MTPTNLLLLNLLNQIVFFILLGVGLIEKGLSMLENRPYSPRRVIAYALIVFGIKKLTSLFVMI